MTKEITQAFIIQQIQDKFKLRDHIPEKFLFLESVVPTYDIGEHVKNTVARWRTVSITSGPAGFSFLTVPDTERWHLLTYNIIFMAAGAYTVTGLYIKRAKEYNANSFIYLDMTLGQTVSYAQNLPKAVRLDPGDEISVYIDSYTSTADLRLYLDYIEEKIR